MLPIKITNQKLRPNQNKWKEKTNSRTNNNNWSSGGPWALGAVSVDAELVTLLWTISFPRLDPATRTATTAATPRKCKRR